MFNVGDRVRVKAVVPSLPCEGQIGVIKRIWNDDGLRVDVLFQSTTACFWFFAQELEHLAAMRATPGDRVRVIKSGYGASLGDEGNVSVDDQNGHYVVDFVINPAWGIGSSIKMPYSAVELVNKNNFQLASGHQHTFDFGIDDQQKAEWKRMGHCEICGTRREMSIHGLLDCVYHPTSGGKQ